ncbi:hypothetical protein B6S05_00765 [Enterococcus faecium]|nr:hypothetical protein B6S05_00765 [Enterococcus faecium]AWV60248.1 hypothetical protein B6S06_00770 [Enterococcus faecium]
MYGFFHLHKIFYTLKFFCENYFYIIYMSKIYIIKEMLFDQLLFGISSKQNGKVYGATLPFCFSNTQVSL